MKTLAAASFLALIAPIVPVRAEPGDGAAGQSVAKSADSQATAVLLTRLEALEKRILELEGQLKDQEAAQGPSSDGAEAYEDLIPAYDQPGPAGGGYGSAAVPPQPQVPTTSGGYVIVTPEQAARAADESGIPREDPSAQAVAREDGDVAAAALLFRDTVPTLTRRQLEISEELAYTRNQGNLQSDRVFMSTTAVRYGIMNGLELGAIIPAYWGIRETQVGLNEWQSYDVADIGDITLQGSGDLWEQNAWRPGAALTLGAILPTSTYSPYLDDVKALRPGTDPRNIIYPYQAQQHWATFGNLQFFKTYDPVIIYLGLGLQYTFAQEFSGVEIRPGLTFNYNAGISMGLSEHTSFGFQVFGGYAEGLWVNGLAPSAPAAEQHSARVSIIQGLWPGVYLEPAVSFGLNAQSANSTFSTTVRKRF
ncbi:hypothetical protein [Methyloceanibacter methanicus]|uniref:hypothetical protein n=1 Tax=Methyloceanibacter methanicus TaxID=1774968 RepID=UPI00114CE44A|nr:hypothetical protein [Methyloceanibacter methanicus]